MSKRFSSPWGCRVPIGTKRWPQSIVSNFWIDRCRQVLNYFSSQRGSFFLRHGGLSLWVNEVMHNSILFPILRDVPKEEYRRPITTFHGYRFFLPLVSPSFQGWQKGKRKCESCTACKAFRSEGIMKIGWSFRRRDFLSLRPGNIDRISVLIQTRVRYLVLLKYTAPSCRNLTSGPFEM